MFVYEKAKAMWVAPHFPKELAYCGRMRVPKGIGLCRMNFYDRKFLPVYSGFLVDHNFQ